MFKKILAFILIGAMVFIASGCKEREEKTVQINSEISSDNSSEIPQEGSYTRCVEMEEKVPYNVAGSAELPYIDEDIIFEESDLIFKGAVIDEVEIGLYEYFNGELNYIYYKDVFTFEVEKIYYSEDPALQIGDVIRVVNGGGSSDWIPGTLKMEIDKEYIVLTAKVTAYSNVEFSKYYDYSVIQPWMAIISIENGDYFVDEGLTSLISGAKEEIIREDHGYKATIYVKGEEFEEELEDLISQKKGES